MPTSVTSKRPDEREFVVDPGASIHMMSEKISSEESWTVKMSRTLTVVLTANGEVRTHEETQVFVHDTLYVCIMCLYVCFSYCVRCISHVFQNVMCVKCDTSVVMDFRKSRTASLFGHENFKATKVAASTES